VAISGTVDLHGGSGGLFLLPGDHAIYPPPGSMVAGAPPLHDPLLAADIAAGKRIAAAGSALAEALLAAKAAAV
jgi:hypothetical protein